MTMRTTRCDKSAIKSAKKSAKAQQKLLKKGGGDSASATAAASSSPMAPTTIESVPTAAIADPKWSFAPGTGFRIVRTSSPASRMRGSSGSRANDGSGAVRPQ